MADFEGLEKLPPNERLQKIKELQEKRKNEEKEAQKLLEKTIAELESLKEKERQLTPEQISELNKVVRTKDDASLEVAVANEEASEVEAEKPYDTKEWSIHTLSERVSYVAKPNSITQFSGPGDQMRNVLLEHNLELEKFLGYQIEFGYLTQEQQERVGEIYDNLNVLEASTGIPKGDQGTIDTTKEVVKTLLSSYHAEDRYSP